MAGSSKKRSKSEFDDVAEFSPKKFSNDQFALYFFYAFLVSILPAYLYYSVYDLTLEEFGFFFILVTIGASILLTLAYRNVARVTISTLASQRKAGASGLSLKKLNLTREELEKHQERSTEKEAELWSFALNNAIFSLLFLFFAFYVLRAIATPYNYTLSVAISAAATYQLSVATAK